MNCIVVVVEDLFAQGEVSGVFEGDRMESDGEIGERCPPLNIFQCSLRPAPERWGAFPKRKQTLRSKGKRQPQIWGAAGSALSEKGKHPKTEG